MARLDFEIMGSGSGIAVIKLNGVLDSNGPLCNCKTEPTDTLIIDLIGFSAMNSLGVREFMTWGSTLKNPKITFLNCPKFFIDHVNNVPNFMPQNSTIGSFFVPFFSEQNLEEEMILFEKGFAYGLEPGKSEIFWPQVKDTQGVLMMPDVVEAKYFRFLTKYG